MNGKHQCIWLSEGKERGILSTINMHNPPAFAVNKILVGATVLLYLRLATVTNCL